MLLLVWTWIFLRRILQLVLFTMEVEAWECRWGMLLFDWWLLFLGESYSAFFSALSALASMNMMSVSHGRRSSMQGLWKRCISETHSIYALILPCLKTLFKFPTLYLRTEHVHKQLYVFLHLPNTLQHTATHKFLLLTQIVFILVHVLRNTLKFPAYFCVDEDLALADGDILESFEGRTTC